MRVTRYRLRKLQRSKEAASGEAPVNLVPMIDILTVLVLYLLVGSVYEHLAILQLNLPSASAQAPQKNEPPPLQLTVTVREQSLELSDRSAVLRRLPNTPDGYNLSALAAALDSVKQKSPKEDSVTLLLEPDIPYDTLVQVMDTVRLAPLREGDDPDATRAEMFPNISIGDAPQPGARS